MSPDERAAMRTLAERQIAYPADMLRLLDALDAETESRKAGDRVAWRIAVSLKDIGQTEELPDGYDIEEAWARFSTIVGIERAHAVARERELLLIIEDAVRQGYKGMPQ